VTRDDLLWFATRDWAAVAEAKKRHWLRRRRRSSYADLLQLSDDLRRHGRALAPASQPPDDRLADVEVHQRVGEALRAISRAAR
jgi:hypothetical protein